MSGETVIPFTKETELVYECTTCDGTEFRFSKKEDQDQAKVICAGCGIEKAIEVRFL